MNAASDLLIINMNILPLLLSSFVHEHIYILYILYLDHKKSWLKALANETIYTQMNVFILYFKIPAPSSFAQSSEQFMNKHINLNKEQQQGAA